MDDKQKILWAIGLILAAAFLLYEFHYKDSLSLVCSHYSPMYDKAACIGRGGSD